MAAHDQPDPDEGPAAPVAEESAPPPPVTWAAPPPESAGISIVSVLREAFARYAADPIRLFVVGLIPSVLVLLVANSPGPTLLVSALSLLATSIVMVVTDQGPDVPFGVAARLGLNRVGWLLLASLAIGILVLGAAIVPIVIIAVTAGQNSGLLAVLLLLLAFPIAWIYMRLILAIPGVVIDRLRPNPALGRARAATKSLSTTVQVFVIVLIASLVSTPVALAAGVLVAVHLVPAAVIYGIGGLCIAFVAPVSPLAFVSMYRRVYPRLEASLPETPSADDPDTARETPAAPVPVTAPPFGRAARAFAGATLALGIAGGVAFAWTLGGVASGALAGATGNVPRGTIVFGTAASITTCTVTGRFAELAPGGSVTWMGSLTRRSIPSDRIRLGISVNGVEAGDTAQSSGVFDCLGNNVPEKGLSPGVYTLTLYVNDQVSATGSFTAR